jgi:hypothetical protein
MFKGILGIEKRELFQHLIKLVKTLFIHELHTFHEYLSVGEYKVQIFKPASNTNQHSLEIS